MVIKEEIFKFISKHEVQVSEDMTKCDNSIKVRFTTFGNRAACKALYEVIEMLDEETKIKIIDMMRNKHIN